MGDRVGQQLGNYRLIRLIGEGGFAQVYLAEHLFLKRRAAVKVLHQQVTKDALEEFRREAEMIARLEHPNIVRVLEFGIEHNVPFLVMSYASNGTLRQRHREGSRLPLDTIVGYLKQVAPALQYAHMQRVIHRDVKPQNMLIGLSDEILLSDFGIAVVSESTALQGTQNKAGTTAYMAPEQSQGRPCFASDQYALGVVVYEWLCGERPFKGTALEIAMQHQLATPHSLCGHVPYISPALEQVVFKALAKYPQQRFASVQDFVSAFEQAHRLPSLRGTSLAPFPSPQPLPPAPYPPMLRSQLPTAVPPQSTPAPTPALNVPRGRRGATALKLLPASIGLALLLIVGSILLNLLNSTVTSHNMGVQGSATAQALALASEHASATAAAPAYITGTSKGVMLGFNAQRTNFNPYEKALTPTNVSLLVQDWATPIGSDGYTESTPAVANGVLYVGADDSKLYAINAISGKMLWTATTSNYISSSPAVANGIVYVSSRDEKLYAFRASSGKMLWTASTSNTIQSSPAVVNDIVYVGSDKLYAFNAISGRVLWTAGTSGYIACSPAVANGIVYVDADKLYAFNATSGRVLWTAPVGTARWTTATGDITFSPAVVNGVVYIGTDKLYALNASTGKVLWSASAGDYVSSSPAVANGVVYISANDGKLYAFNTSTGKMLWSISITGFSASSPVVANGVIYLGANTLSAFDATSGKTLWTDSDNANYITSSATVVNGIIYVSARDHICAFHLPA